MNQRGDLDRLIDAWPDELYAAPASRILGKVLEETRQTRQRRAWASLERWLPMTVISRPAAAPVPLRVVYLVVVTLLILALAASVAIVGSQLLRGTAVIPTGDAAVFAFGTFLGDAGGDIHTVRADGTDLRRLTDGPGFRSVASWSPDGTRIAYRLWRDGADSVEVIDAGGGDLRTLATNAQTDQYCVGRWSLAWSPDGSSLIFPTRDGCAGDYGLSVVATDGSSPPVALLAPGVSSLYGTWSPDGTRIAFLGKEGSGSVGVYVIDASAAEAAAGGLQARRIGPDLGSSLDEGPGGPRWAPDGTELLVAGTGPSVAGEAIWAIQADGSGERLVVEDALNPSWSPDGTRIAFHRVVDPAEYFEDRPCTVRTWIVDATGANERALDERADGCGYEPLWSPDGSRIADMLIVAAPDDPDVTFHLGVRSVDGGEATAILPDGTAGSWQPVAAPLPPAPSFAVASPTT